MIVRTRAGAIALVALMLALCVSAPLRAQPVPENFLYYIILDGKWYEAPPGEPDAWISYLVSAQTLMAMGSTQVNCRRTNGQQQVMSPMMLIYGQTFGFVYLHPQFPVEYEWLETGGYTALMLNMTSATGDVICDNALIEEPIPAGRADLAVTLTDSQDPVTPGTPYSYTASVHNAGPDPASSVKILFVMPSQASYIDATGTGWTCSRAGVQVTCTRPSLAVGATAMATVYLVSPGTSGVVEASATVSSSLIDQNLANNTSIQTTTISGQASTADLSLSMTDSHDPVVVSTQFDYRLRVENLGPAAAANVKIDYSLPGPLTYHTTQGTGWSCTMVSRKVTCTRSTLAANQVSDVVVTVSAPGVSTTITNTASVSSATPDQVPGNNTATQITEVVLHSASADVAVAVEPLAGIQASAEYTYVLAISNGGPMATTGVMVESTLPAGGQYRGSSGAGWTCVPPSVDPRQVVCARSTLAVGASAPLQIEVKAPATAGLATFITSVRSARADAVLGNNTKSITHPISGGGGDSGSIESLIFSSSFEWSEWKFSNGFEEK